MAVYMESLLFDLETMAPSGASPVLQLTEVMTESGPCHPGAGRGAARLLCRLALALVAALACAALAAPAPGGLFSPKELSQGYRDGVVIAKPKAAMLASIDAIERAEGLRLQARFERLGNIRVVGLAQGDTVAAAVGRLRATGRYEYVEPDFIRHITTVPDDPQFPSQWGLHNDGSGGGLAGADINAEAGWSVRSGAPSVIAAIVDSGPRAIRLQKELIREWEAMPMSDAIQAGIRMMGRAYETDEPRRMVAAARERLRTRKK